VGGPDQNRAIIGSRPGERRRGRTRFRRK
jgi:hypothetical protein